MASLPGTRQAVRYARSNKLPAILLLFLLAAGIASARAGRLPTKRQAAGLLGAALVVVLAASYVPDVVAAFLAALVVILAIESAEAVAGVLERILNLIAPVAPGTFARIRESGGL